jgi:hypothetical protein
MSKVVIINRSFIEDKISKYKKLKSKDLINGHKYNTIINELEEILEESAPLTK